MIKYVARDRSNLPTYLGNALLVTATSAAALTLCALVLRPHVLPSSAGSAMLLAVALADLLGMESTTVCQQVFLALEQGRRFSHLIGFSTGIRLLAALVLVAWGGTATHWAYLYSASALITMAAAIVVVSRCCARPRFKSKLFMPSVREGVHFATALASQSVYNDIDKTMLARLHSVEAAAIYAAAYRFIEAAILPIRSVANAAYPDFFRHGASGVTSSFAFAKKILRRSSLYGLGIAFALFAAAGVIPLVLGRAYVESAPALRWLSLLPFMKCVHIFFSDTLTGANYQWQTSSAQIVVAAFNVLINLWIIRAYGWKGAAWSSLATDGLLALSLFAIIQWHVRRERQSADRQRAEALETQRRDSLQGWVSHP